MKNKGKKIIQLSQTTENIHSVYILTKSSVKAMVIFYPKITLNRKNSKKFGYRRTKRKKHCTAGTYIHTQSVLTLKVQRL